MQSRKNQKGIMKASADRNLTGKGDVRRPGSGPVGKFGGLWRHALLIMLCALSPKAVQAVFPPGNTNLSNTLETWSFNDTTGWTNDHGFAPISFTNLNSSILGNGSCLVLDSTNSAWLQYNITEASGTNNLTLAQGTIMGWFAPNWIDVNSGGTGPGQFGRFIDVGSYTTNASYGWWSVYLDPAGTNVYFAAQTNNGSSVVFLSAPVSFEITNLWHMFALTYCSTGCAFYFDGLQVTNGSGVTIWPGPNVLTNGFFIGSDNSGVAQAHGMFDDIATYNYCLAPQTITTAFIFSSFLYYENPYNRANLTRANSSPTNSPYFNVISGSGSLVTNGSIPCVTSSSVWITNASATVRSNGLVDLTFGIVGSWNGTNGPFDVFANSVLGPTNAAAFGWAWMGQGLSCQSYKLTFTNSFFSAYIILGTPQDTDGDGLTDAYELLVSHTSPTNVYSGNDGIPDAWKVLWNIPATGVVANEDPDLDALLNLQEYLWGTNPRINDGLTPWISCPSGFSGIP